MFFISFLLRNKYRPEESAVDMSTPVHPVVPPLISTIINKMLVFHEHKSSYVTPPVTIPPDLETTAGKLRNHTFSAGIRNIMTGK